MVQIAMQGHPVAQKTFWYMTRLHCIKDLIVPDFRKIILNAYKIHTGGSRETILSFFAVFYLPCHPILETSVINNSLNVFFWQSKLEITFCIKCINMSNLGIEWYIFA